MSSNRDKGRHGEGLAVEYLQSQGYSILARNYTCRFGEIDIIAKDGDTIVFAEVKARRQSVYGRPGEAVTPAKQRKIILTAQAYMQNMGLDDTAMRFDVLEVYLDYSRVCHIEQAF